MIRISFKHQYEPAVTVAQFAEHEITCPEIWFLAYVHPSMTISSPAKKSPLGSDHASNNLSSLYVIMLDENRLISATAVRDAQITAANPATNIKMLNKAVNMSLLLSALC